MARAQSQLSHDVQLLDSEGLSKFMANDPYLTELIRTAQDKDALVALSNLTLRNANLHGHKYAIDSVVAATALGFSGPRIIVTSDVDDMNKLCGDKVRAVAV